MIHLRLKLRLELLGPVLTQSTSAGSMGLDAVMARTLAGKPYLPYSQVRGKLRQSLEELGEKVSPTFVHHWFGPRQATNDQELDRGNLYFTDFVHPLPKDKFATRTRIQIDDQTRAAKDRMLMVIDSPFEVNELAAFDGEIVSICSPLEEAEEAVKYIVAGMKSIRQMGAERTVGFGRVQTVNLIDVSLTELTQKVAGKKPRKRIEDLFRGKSFQPAITHQQTKVQNLAGTRFVLRIRPRQPLCIGGITENGNLIRSEEIIPGGAILGSIGTIWRQASGLPAREFEVKEIESGHWNALAKNFGNLIVTHAIPSPKGTNTRPCAVPLSLVAAEPWTDIPDDLYDVSLCKQPRLIPVKNDSSNRPPVFQSDWKSHVVSKKADAAFGWTSVPKELRVRTAIDSQSLRAAEEQLFAYHMVVQDQHEWLAYLDLYDVPSSDRASVLAELQQLLSAGLGPLGKTKAWADVSIEPVSKVIPKWSSNVNELPDGGWVITLQTPAVLCGAESLRDPTGGKLHEGYNNTFDKLSKSSLRLNRFFARQSLAAPRFAGKLPTNDRGQYYPFILTDTGSTFVLEAAGDKAEAQASIEEWLARGIPVCDEFLGGNSKDADWKRCPYLNRHGYGEISVNQPWLNGQFNNDMPTCLRDE